MTLVNNDFYNFIEQFKDADPCKLRLSGNRFNQKFDVDFAITQIECRKKFKAKFSRFISNDKFLFPNKISAEQASHQAVATYHRSLLPDYRISVLDMTAGLGIDAMTLANGDNKVTAIELDPLKASILSHNSSVLNITDFSIINTDSIKFLSEVQTHYDLIFIDPARRDADNRKVYNFHDCSPDIISSQSTLLGKGARVLIKGSPLLDVSQTLKDFNNIKAIRAIGVKGECKELLIELNSYKKSLGNEASMLSEIKRGPVFEAINLDTEGKVISLFSLKGNINTQPSNFLEVKDLRHGAFILEPSAMVMKLSPWQEISQKFNAVKFSPSSHLFLSYEMPDNFPGRVSRLKNIITKKDRKLLSESPVTVISKNYPLSAEQLRKTLKLKEGDRNFLYASRISNQPILLFSESISG